MNYAINQGIFDISNISLPAVKADPTVIRVLKLMFGSMVILSKNTAANEDVNLDLFFEVMSMLLI